MGDGWSAPTGSGKVRGVMVESSGKLMALEAKLNRSRTLPPPAECREIRLRAGATKVDLAEVLGVTRQALALWENGTHRPRGENLHAYIDVLDMLRRVAEEGDLWQGSWGRPNP